MAAQPRLCIENRHGVEYISIDLIGMKRDSDWRAEQGWRNYVLLSEAESALPLDTLTKPVFS